MNEGGAVTNWGVCMVRVIVDVKFWTQVAFDVSQL